MGLLIEAMSLIFILWSMESHRGSCVQLVVVTVLPLIEVLTRFHNMCFIGELVRQEVSEWVEGFVSLSGMYASTPKMYLKSYI